MSQIIHYDMYWKRVIQKDFKSFIAFFLPDVLPHVNFNRAPIFIDKEFHQLFPNQLKGKREGDNLVKIYLKDGKEKWVVIHVEVQSQSDSDFASRMFAYYYRILDKYETDIIPLAIFTSDIKAHSIYKRTFFGGEVYYKYNVFEVREMKGREKELGQSDNVFAAIVLASLYAYQTKGKNKSEREKRLLFKTELFKLLLDRKHNEDAIMEFLAFVDGVLWLPKSYQESFIEKISNVHNMDDKLILTDNNRMLLSAWSKAAWGFDMVKQAEVIQQKDETIQQKDEAIQQKDETIQQKDEAIQQKDEAIQQKDEAIQQKDEAIQQKDEAIKLLKEQQSQQIKQLYKSGKMTDLNELASFFNVDLTFVKNALKNR